MSPVRSWFTARKVQIAELVQAPTEHQSARKINEGCARYIMMYTHRGINTVSIERKNILE